MKAENKVLAVFTKGWEGSSEVSVDSTPDFGPATKEIKTRFIFRIVTIRIIAGIMVEW